MMQQKLEIIAAILLTTLIKGFGQCDSAVSLPYYFSTQASSFTCTANKPMPRSGNGPQWTASNKKLFANTNCTPYNTGYCANEAARFYLPKMYLQAGKQYRFSYRYATSNSVRGTTISSGNWLDTYLSTDTTIVSAIKSFGTIYPIDTYAKVSTQVIAPIVSGTYYISFVFNSNIWSSIYQESYTFGTLTVDDIGIEEINNCAIPVCVTLSTTDTTLNTATLSWSNTPVAANYNWELRSESGDFASGVADTNSIIVSGLNPNTRYYPYIKNNCTTGTQSLWSDPLFPYKPDFPDEWQGAQPVNVKAYNYNVNFSPISWPEVMYSNPTRDYVFNCAPAPVNNGSVEDVWVKFTSKTAGAVVQIKNYTINYPSPVQISDLLRFTVYKTTISGGISAAVNSGLTIMPLDILYKLSKNGDTTMVQMSYPFVSGEGLITGLVPGEKYYLRLFTPSPRYRRLSYSVGFYEQDVSMGSTNAIRKGITQYISPSNNNTLNWVNLGDTTNNTPGNASKIIAAINAQGNTPNAVRTSLYKNRGAIRKDAKGILYFDRNVRIDMANEVPVKVRIYIAQSEIDAYAAATGYTFNDLRITQNSDTASPAIAAAGLLINPTARGSYDVYKYLEFETATSGSFYIHGGNTALQKLAICPGSNTFFVSSNNTTGNTYQWQVDTGIGFVNIGDNIQYSGSQSDTLKIINPATSWYGYRYRCVLNGSNITPAYQLTFAATWTGNSSNAWQNPANWSCGIIPDENTDVTVNNAANYYPQVNTNAACGSLKLMPGAAVTVKTGMKLEVKRK